MTKKQQQEEKLRKRHKVIGMLIDKYYFNLVSNMSYTSFALSIYKSSEIADRHFLLITDKSLQLSNIPQQDLKKYLRGLDEEFYFYLSALYHTVMARPCKDECEEGIYDCYAMLINRIPPHGLGIDYKTYMFTASKLIDKLT